MSLGVFWSEHPGNGVQFRVDNVKLPEYLLTIGLGLENQVLAGISRKPVRSGFQFCVYFLKASHEWLEGSASFFRSQLDFRVAVLQLRVVLLGQLPNSTIFYVGNVFGPVCKIRVAPSQNCLRASAESDGIHFKPMHLLT